MIKIIYKKHYKLLTILMELIGMVGKKLTTMETKFLTNIECVMNV
jgi:hypothetical protein